MCKLLSLFAILAVTASPQTNKTRAQSGTLQAHKPELIVQTGHSSAIDSLAFSPDGRIMASSSAESLVLWDVTTGAELRTLKGHSQAVSSVAFHPNGGILASGSYDRTVKLWDVITGRGLRTFKGHSDIITCIAFGAGGKILASGSYDSTIKIWDAATGRELHTLSGPFDRIMSVAFSPDGRFLASGSLLGRIKLWDVNSGLEWHSLRDSPGEENNLRVYSVAFSPDGKVVASAEGKYDGAFHGAVRLWDVGTGNELRSLATLSAYFRSIVFSPDAKVLAAASEDHKVRLYDIDSGGELQTLEESAVSIAFSPDGKLLASGGWDHALKLWKTDTGKRLRNLEGQQDFFASAVFSPDGKILATSSSRQIRLWNVGAGVDLQSLSAKANTVPFLVAFSPDSKLLAWGTTDGTVKLWDVNKSKELHLLKGHTVNWLSFSPDGKILATSDSDLSSVVFTAEGGVSGRGDHSIKLWDVENGNELRTLKGHTLEIRAVVFSPDGKLLASGGYDKVIKLWDSGTGKELRTFSGHDDAIWSMAFSPDGRLLASGSNGASVKLWDLKAGVAMRTINLDPNDTVFRIGFSPDGSLLAISSYAGIGLWDVHTGQRLHSFGDTGISFTFSRDGKILVTTGNGMAVKLWDMTTRKELARLIAFGNEEWGIVTTDGLFDGSPFAWSRMIWRSPDDTLDYAPVESYFNDFFYPGLLADIFSGLRPQAARNVAEKDRRRPVLELTQPAGSRETQTASGVTLGIVISQAPAGAQDVRLFRNGSLVKYWRGDVMHGKSSITLETTIPIVAGENRLTAYAFNRDNVKSGDAMLTVTGPESLLRKGVLRILAIGVGRYANHDYDLNYTPDDATSFASQLNVEQEKLGVYQSVEIKTILNEGATKENILSELKRLAQSARPEDGVVVYFSGHGKADGDHFYLVPHDLGYSGQRNNLSSDALRQVLMHSISDTELEEIFRGIDAGQLVMIIDACNSGQALENKDEPRRGPMNTRGLAQLAYEKGMYILTASQSVEEAFVSERLKHSYLTYALVEEGLKSPAADGNHNGELSLREWFDYALARVPKLRDEALQQKSLVEEGPAVKAARSQKSQTPRVFYRREADVRSLIVANVGNRK